MSYQLAIFDFDGTLADTFPWFIGVVNGVADLYGFKRIESHEVDTLRGQGARQIVRHLGIPAWKLPLIARHMRRLAARDVARIRLFEGADAALRALAGAGVGIAVVSSNGEDVVRRTFGPALAGLVDHYACGAAMFGKAAKFRRVVKASGVAPSRTICIGDELRDTDAARAAGLAFGAVAWGYTRADALRSSGPDLMIERIGDLAPCLLGDLLPA